ncbi:MAG: hypothetical protein L6Q72_01000 [Burkholderiaceae bacterium]|nr:hypothetical protein [Burkholderiaceae bacterium]
MEQRYSDERRLEGLERLDPREQAKLLNELAHEARLIEFAVDSGGADAHAVGAAVERALELAVDADSESEARQAYAALEEAMAAVRRAGLTLSAGVSRMEVEGALGLMQMPVLTAVLATNGRGAR